MRYGGGTIVRLENKRERPQWILLLQSEIEIKFVLSAAASPHHFDSESNHSLVAGVDDTDTAKDPIGLR